jgi:hypothetical protein
MFFVGILGIESKQKEIRTIPNMMCKACGRLTSYSLIKTYNYFQLFFIAIFKWGETYRLMSKCCGSVFELTKEQGEDLEKGNTSDFNDLNIIMVENNSCRTNIFCHNCGARLK